jgi:hypothetical protein
MDAIALYAARLGEHNQQQIEAFRALRKAR